MVSATSAAGSATCLETCSTNPWIQAEHDAQVAAIRELWSTSVSEHPLSIFTRGEVVAPRRTSIDDHHRSLTASRCAGRNATRTSQSATSPVPPRSPHVRRARTRPRLGLAARTRRRTRTSGLSRPPHCRQPTSRNCCQSWATASPSGGARHAPAPAARRAADLHSANRSLQLVRSRAISAVQADDTGDVAVQGDHVAGCRQLSAVRRRSA